MLGRFGLEDIGVRMVVDNLDGFTAGMKKADRAVGNTVGALERYQAQTLDTEKAIDQMNLSVERSMDWLSKHRSALRGIGIGMTAVGAGALKLIGDVDKLTDKWGDNLTTMERWRIGLGKILTPFEGLLQAVTMMGPLLVVLSTQWGRNAAAQIYSAVATKANTLAMNTFALSATAAAAAVRTLMIALGLLAAAVTIGMLLWSSAEQRKRNETMKTTEAIKQQIAEQRNAKTLALEIEEAAIRATYDKATEYVRAYYGDVQDTDNSLMAQRRRQYDETLRLIESELNAALDAKRKEYNAALAVIDLELGRSLAPLEARLDKMEEAQQAEERLRADRLDAERIAELTALMASAETEDEILSYKKQIADIEEQANYRHQQQMYQDKRDAILSEMDDLRQSADDKRKLADQEYSAQIQALQTAADEHKAVLDKQLAEDIARINQQGLVYMSNAQRAYDNDIALVEARRVAWDKFYVWLEERQKEWAAEADKSVNWFLSGTLGRWATGKDENSFLDWFFGGTIGRFLTGGAPKNQQYGGISEGGPTWVGERGRELVYMPQGAQVVPNNQTTNYNVTANYLNPQQPASLAMDLEAIRMMARV